MSPRRIMLVAALLIFAGAGRAADRPNVLLVITDDQGFGDLGAHGNPVVKTPGIDAFAKNSAWLKNFYVSPVCSPTRSSLLSGLYNYRTGVVDTFLGRAMMRPGVRTLAERLGEQGYRTGLFGKWHLGDNYPLRPEDRGFQTTLWHNGGGLAQPSDSPEMKPATAYFDPVLIRNGREVKTKGYCTDVFTDAALDFIAADKREPFFAYVAYNAPHDPFEVPDSLAAPYRKLDLTAAGFPKSGQPWAGPKVNTEQIAAAYGMIENIDTNFGRLLKALEEKKLADDTLVIFMTDNGPGGVRYNAGLRNRKGTVYEGGIRVPCYVRLPGRIKPGHVIEQPAAHIDLTPTILDLCHVAAKDSPAFDGRSLTALLAGTETSWPNRTIFLQWHRGNAPERYRAFAARGPRYKLVQATGVAPENTLTPKFELFDLKADPFEQTDLASDRPDEIAALKKQYDDWFTDVTKTGFDPVRVHIGSEHENPARLSRQDWRGPNAGWTADSLGYWEAFAERAGTYEFTVRSRTGFSRYELDLDFPENKQTVGPRVSGPVATPDDNKSPILQTKVNRTLPKGPVRLTARVGDVNKMRGADYLEVRFVEVAK
ncbi:arylsulfatase [Fimbriiglobus ruber]|uniref:Choline-sulfatase n=1 Tax=Fimbriiglobus ruber TaxID=1908690 RepID=A0A225EFL8_9BACT|nr:arylsulfatase [Fimbriiglobus ruber]OWK47145.1 Choline-sulfatase [Fimbriiglobus ruber]